MNTTTSTIVLLFAIVAGLAIAGIAAIATNIVTQSDVQSADAIDSGKRIFSNRCSGCHSVQPGKNSGFGPSLANIGTDASSRIDGMTRVEYIVESIVNPESYRAPDAIGHMPRGTLSGAGLKQARELITYVASLGAPAPGNDEFATLEVTPASFALQKSVSADLATLQLGQELFLDKLGCNACHTIFNNPGQALYAPSLGHAANLSAEYISESLRNPSAIIASGYSIQTVTLNDGTKITGRLLKDNTSSITMLFRGSDLSPQTVTIDQSEISETLVNQTSSMPPYNLSESDEFAIIAFLGSLDAEVPEP